MARQKLADIFGAVRERSFTEPEILTWVAETAFLVARGSGLSVQDAKDVSQDCCLRLLRLAAFEQRTWAELASYVHRTIKSCMIDWIRNQRGRTLKREEIPIDEYRDDLATAVQDLSVSIDVKTVLGKLPDRQRVVLELWSQGLSYEEIAEHLKCSVSIVKNCLHRGKIRVRELMTQSRRQQTAVATAKE